MENFIFYAVSVYNICIFSTELQILGIWRYKNKLLRSKIELYKSIETEIPPKIRNNLWTNQNWDYAKSDIFSRISYDMIYNYIMINNILRIPILKCF